MITSTVDTMVSESIPFKQSGKIFAKKMPPLESDGIFRNY